MPIIAVNYGIYSHVDPVALATAAASDANFLKALQHRTEISGIEDRVKSGELSEVDGARLGLKECDAGIGLLRAGLARGTNEVLVVLVVSAHR